jgi:cyclophilin family peptidyl-prolyl cis-trans isomerase
VGMATNDANQATSEFFFNAIDNSSTLANGYSVFADITSGVDVAQAILAAPVSCTSDALHGVINCLPQPDVTIKTATQIP